MKMRSETWSAVAWVCCASTALVRCKARSAPSGFVVELTWLTQGLTQLSSVFYFTPCGIRCFQQRNKMGKRPQHKIKDSLKVLLPTHLGSCGKAGG